MKSTHTNFKKETYDADMPLHERNFNDRNRAYSKRSSPKVEQMYGAIIEPRRLELYATSKEKLDRMVQEYMKHTDCDQVRYLN